MRTGLLKKKSVALRINKYYRIKPPGASQERVLQFVRSTPKGFNFVYPGTKKYRLRKHLYDRAFAHREIPDDLEVFCIELPASILIVPAEDYDSPIKSKFKIGDKVVPISKTMDGRIPGLENSACWKKALGMNQPFIYVKRTPVEDGIPEYVCSHNDVEGGDYFHERDLVEYTGIPRITTTMLDNKLQHNIMQMEVTIPEIKLLANVYCTERIKSIDIELSNYGSGLKEALDKAVSQALLEAVNKHLHKDISPDDLEGVEMRSTVFPMQFKYKAEQKVIEG